MYNINHSGSLCNNCRDLHNITVLFENLITNIRYVVSPCQVLLCICSLKSCHMDTFYMYITNSDGYIATKIIICLWLIHLITIQRIY